MELCIHECLQETALKDKRPILRARRPNWGDSGKPLKLAACATQQFEAAPGHPRGSVLVGARLPLLSHYQLSMLNLIAPHVPGPPLPRT